MLFFSIHILFKWIKMD